MSETQRQLWIGIVMDLLLEYYSAQQFVCSELNDADDPGELNKTMAPRIAEAVGDGATAEFVIEIFERRLTDAHQP